MLLDSAYNVAELFYMQILHQKNPWKCIRLSEFRKPRNLVFFSLGKPWKMVLKCLYKHCQSQLPTCILPITCFFPICTDELIELLWAAT